MFEKGIDNILPYFKPFNPNAFYRIQVTTTVFIITFTKAFILKSLVDQYREKPNEMMVKGEEQGFYLSAVQSMAAAGAWILLDFISSHLKHRLAESLRSDIGASILDKLQKPKLAFVLKSQYPDIAASLPQLLACGITDYSISIVENTLGFITQSVDFLSSAYSFSQRSDRSILMTCFATTALMSLFSFYLTQGSRGIVKAKNTSELFVRIDARNVVENSFQIVSKKAEGNEIESLRKNFDKLGENSSSKTSFEARNSSLNWLMTDLSSRILSATMAPLVFAQKLSFQTEFFALNRELYQVRSFVLWICAVVTSNFASLNEQLFNTRTALDDCLKKVSNSKLVFDNKCQLRINNLRLFTADRSKTILDLSDPVIFKAGVYLLRGANSTGKSTLLNAIAGISFGNAEGHISTATEERQVYVPQEVNHKDGISILDLIIYPKSIRDFSPRTPTDVRKEIIRMLDYFNLGHLSADLDQIGNWSSELSGGHKQIISIVQALINHPKVILLDEVTSAMSSDVKILAKNLIKNYALKNQDVIVIHIEHDGRNDERYYTHRLSIENRKLIVNEYSSRQRN